MEQEVSDGVLPVFVLGSKAMTDSETLSDFIQRWAGIIRTGFFL